MGNVPKSVTVGDFNGDGNEDLATANSASFGLESVSILLGNGDGSFLRTQDVTGEAHPSSMTVGDFNGDGDQISPWSGALNMATSRFC